MTENPKYNLGILRYYSIFSAEDATSYRTIIPTHRTPFHRTTTFKIHVTGGGFQGRSQNKSV